MSKIKKQKLSLSDLTNLITFTTEEEIKIEVIEKPWAWVVVPEKKESDLPIIAIKGWDDRLTFIRSSSVIVIKASENEIKSVWEYGKFENKYRPENGEKPPEEYEVVFHEKDVPFCWFYKDTINTYRDQSNSNVSVSNRYHSWVENQTENIPPRCNLPTEYFDFLLNGGTIEY